MRKVPFIMPFLFFYCIPTFSQERKIPYEQIALNYFVDSIWTKNVVANSDRVYVIPQVNSQSTYLRAPFKLSSGKELIDSTETEAQEKRFRNVKDLDLTKDSLIVYQDKVPFTYLSPVKSKKINLKKSKVIEVYRRLPFRPKYYAVQISVSTNMRCDFYYFEIDEAQMQVTRWYSTFLVF